MALVTKMPPDTPTTDALASIPADLLGPIPAEIRLGANVLMMMETPPAVHDVITVVMRLRIKDECKGEAGDGSEELVHYRRCKIVTAWLAGQPEPPDPNADQPALFDHDGKPTDEPERLGDIVNGVDRPGFSDSEGGE